MKIKMYKEVIKVKDLINEDQGIAYANQIEEFEKVIEKCWNYDMEYRSEDVEEVVRRISDGKLFKVCHTLWWNYEEQNEDGMLINQELKECRECTRMIQEVYYK